MADHQQPKQHQDRQPGLTGEMDPQPQDRMENWRPSDKLAGKRAVVTGGDSGIGRAVAIGFAKEGADVVILYKDEEPDAAETKRLVEAAGRRCLAIPGDIGDAAFCRSAADQAAQFLGGHIDVLVNNAAEQHVCKDFADIPEEQVERTFRTNILGMFWVTKAALKHMPAGGAIINSTSITAYRGSPGLIDYAAPRAPSWPSPAACPRRCGASGIRVNAVAPGPIWTPLIPASFDDERTAEHGSGAAMGRAGQPDECAPSYIFLAADSDSSYINGQTMHPNGGTVVNG